MGNRVTATSLVGIVLFAAFAAFIIPSVASAGRGDHPGSLAFSIIERVNQRLCERQEALRGRLFIPLVHPSKCKQEPPPPPAVSVEISADPMMITEDGSSELSWSSENADSCAASGDWNGEKATDGDETVAPDETSTYTITCEGDGGTDSDSVTVTVEEDEPDAPTVEITADPMTITAGQSSELEWNSSNAASCSASNGWSGEKNADGVQTVSPTVTSTYAIECTGDGGSATDSVTITVNAAEPDEGTLVVRKVVIRDDGDTSATTTFSFEVNDGNAIAFESDGENMMTVDAGTYDIVETDADGFTTTYNNCTDVVVGDGETETCTITNNDVEEDAEEPTVSIEASRTTVFEGSSGAATTTLTWNSTDADSCVATNAWNNAIGVDGELVVTPTATSTYAIECTGDGGSATDSVTVNFIGEAEEPGEADVVINEIAWMGTMVNGATSTAGEWIELRNLGSSAVDLTDWAITLATTSGATADRIEITSACANTSVAAGGYYLLVRNSNATSTLSADCVYPGSAATAMSNSGEILTLLDDAEVAMDSVDGSDGWEIGGAPQKGDNDTKETAQRADNDTWFTDSPTPRAAN